MNTIERIEKRKAFQANVAKCKILSLSLKLALENAKTEEDAKFIIETVIDSEYNFELDWLYSTLGTQTKEVILTF